MIENYVRENIILATTGVGCVDPREVLKSHEEERGETRTPGGDFGYCMALMGAVPSLAPEKSIDLVSQWLMDTQQRPFSMHLDHHCKSIWDLGCGHIKEASREGREDLYGIPAIKVKEAYQAALETPEKKLVVLGGKSYNVQGVFVILGETHTIDPNDGESLYYRLDYTRTMKKLNDLVTYLYTRRFFVPFKGLTAIFQKQTEATLGFLAAGKPKYKIDLTSSTSPKVSYLGDI